MEEKSKQNIPAALLKSYCALKAGELRLIIEMAVTPDLLAACKDDDMVRSARSLLKHPERKEMYESEATMFEKMAADNDGLEHGFYREGVGSKSDALQAKQARAMIQADTHGGEYLEYLVAFLCEREIDAGGLAERAPFYINVMTYEQWERMQKKMERARQKLMARAFERASASGREINVEYK